LSRLYSTNADLKITESDLIAAYGIEAFSALSFFKFFDISGFLSTNEIASKTRIALSQIPGCKGTVYIANEGVNGALHVPTKSLVQIKNTIENVIPEIGSIHFNIGETRSSWDVVPFKKLLVKSRPYILTDGLPLSESLDWNDNGHELPARYSVLFSLSIMSCHSTNNMYLQ
jgi:predicted sulfurtransferase